MKQFKVSVIYTDRSQNSANRYLLDIKNNIILTADEEMECFKRYKESGCQNSYKRIYNSLLRFVVSVAKKYETKEIGMSLGDLINEGNIGMLKAIERFDVTRGFRFSSYAVWWIRQSILLYIQLNGPVKKTQHFNEISYRIHETKNRYYVEFGEEMSLEELCDATNISMALAKRTVVSPKNICISMETPIGFDDSELCLHDSIQGDESLSPDFAMMAKNDTAFIMGIMSCLNDIEKKIITSTFGIGMYMPMNLEAIGNEIGLTRERVRQIKMKAIKKMQRKLKRQLA